MNMIRHITLKEGIATLRAYHHTLNYLASHLKTVRYKGKVLYFEAETGLRWHQLFRGLPKQGASS